MRILAVDDEQLQLDKLEAAIKKAVPDAQLVKSRRPAEALFLAEDQIFDVAFLDVQMRGMTGVELGTLLKRVLPHLNIIFVTAFEEFKSDAMDLRASGYITKPVTAEKILEEITNLRYPIKEEIKDVVNEKVCQTVEEKTKNDDNKPLLYVQCFGNFDVFDQNMKPIMFKRSKAKEMMAYLIFRHGSRCSSKEIASVLYEDLLYDTKLQDSFRHVAAAFRKALREVGAEKAIIKEYQNYAIDLSLIKCDYYDFLKDDPNAKKRYTGEFMSQYSWAEFINGYLEYQLMQIKEGQ